MWKSHDFYEIYVFYKENPLKSQILAILSNTFFQFSSNEQYDNFIVMGDQKVYV